MKRLRTISFSVATVAFCALFALWSQELQAQSVPLRAGVAVADITADVRPEDVHDPLYAKVLIVDDGTTEIAIVTLDIVVVSNGIVSDIRTRVQKVLGIDKKNVLISASHNHHTQNQVAKDMAGRTLAALTRASQSKVPVRCGAGVGHEDRITMNRRLRLASGRQWTLRRATPSPRDSEVVGLGPLDPEIGVLRLDTLSGRPLAVLYNFAVHAYGGIPDGRVTADLPGFASSVLEKSLDCPALFVQGAAGDVTPIGYKDVHDPPPTERLGTVLGLSTLDAVTSVAMVDAATVDVVSETIELPKRQDIDARIASLEGQQEQILQFFTGVGCGSHGAGTFLNFKTFLPLYLQHAATPEQPAGASYLYMHERETGQSGLEHLDGDNRQRIEKYLESIAQMERLIELRANLAILQKQRESGDTGPISAEIHGIRIGNFVLVTFPGEPFADIGLRIKRRSPFQFTFLASYTNGHVGYAPTAEAYSSETYEDVHSRLAPEWQAIYETKALEILSCLKGRSAPGSPR